MVTGCKINDGKGYKFSYFNKHIQTLKIMLLKNADEREKVTKELQNYGSQLLCKGCCMVVAHTNNKWLCRSCVTLDEAGRVSSGLSNADRECLSSHIRAANRTHLRVLSKIPNSLRRLWSDCVTATLLKFAKAKTDKDSYLAPESWVKLKL